MSTQYGGGATVLYFWSALVDPGVICITASLSPPQCTQPDQPRTLQRNQAPSATCCHPLGRGILRQGSLSPATLR